MIALVLAIVGWTLFAIVVVAGLVLDLVGLFGNWLILGAVGAAYLFSGYEYFDGWTLPILLGLAILGEVLEAISAGLGAAKFGGGKGAITSSVVGCVLGAMIGTPVFPIIGTIIGACLGAFTAATLYELLMSDRDVESAMAVGLGAALGKIGGMFLKTFVGFAMLIVAALNF